MLTTLSKKNPFAKIKKSNLFEFSTKDYILVLAGYPVLRAFTIASGSEFWVEVYPQIDVSSRIIFFPIIRDKQKENFRTLKRDESMLKQIFNEFPDIYIKKMDKFFNTIPEDISLIVKKYPDSHWELIKAINFIGKDILSVMSSNPALAYLIVNIDKINTSFFFYNELALLKKMILTKQKEILGLCGFPATERVVKIFSKIDPGIINLKDMISFRNLLTNKSGTTKRTLKILSFSKIIDKNLFKLLLYQTPLTDLLPNKVIYQLVSSKSFAENTAKLKRIYLASNRWKITIPEIKSLESLNGIYEKVRKTAEMKKSNKESFPPPPLEDNYYITAICNEKELNSWSKRQQNCVRNYAEKVHLGHNYFYRVKNNQEEATLEIALKNNKIVIGNLLGVGNSDVSIELRKIVNEWFRASKKNKPVKKRRKKVTW